MDFYVSLNKSFGVQTADTVKYEIANPAPQPKTWKDGLHEDSVKFYALGSKVHYYPGDYSDSAWADKFLTSPSVDGYFKNLLNFKDLKEIGNPLNYSWAYWFPDSLGALYLDSTKVRDSAEFKERVVFDKNNYDSLAHAYYVTPFGLPISASAGMKYDYGFDSSSILKVSNDTL